MFKSLSSLLRLFVSGFLLCVLMLVLILSGVSERKVYGGGFISGGFAQMTGDNASYFGDWSKDGKHMLYVTFTEKYYTYHLWRMPTNGGDAKAEYFGEGRYPRYSPDGHFIAFGVQNGGSYTRGADNLWIMDANGTLTSRKFLRAGTGYAGYSLDWYWLDNNRLYYEKFDDVSNSVVGIIYNLDTGKEEQTIAGQDSGYINPSPNGNFLLRMVVSQTVKLESLNNKINLPLTDITAKLKEGINYSEIDFYYFNWSPDSHKLLILMQGYNKEPQNRDFRYRSSNYLKMVTIKEDSQSNATMEVSDISGKLKEGAIHDYYGFNLPIWSLDSSKIAVTISGQDLKDVSTANGTYTQVFGAVYLKAAALTDDFSIKGVQTIDTIKDSSTSSRTYSDFATPKWSPDGKWLTYQKRVSFDGNGVIRISAEGVLVNVQTNNHINFEIPYSAISGFSEFAPDGESIVFSRTYDLGKPHTSDPPRPPSNVWVYYRDKTSVGQPVLNPTLPVPTPFVLQSSSNP